MKLSRERTINNVKRAAMQVVVLAVALFMLSPFLWIIVTSVQQQDYLMSKPPRISLAEIELVHFGQLFSDAKFVKSLVNSLVIVSLSSFVIVVFCSMGGFAVGCLKLPKRNLILFLILAINLAPAITFLIPLYLIISNFGMIDTYAGTTIVFLVFFAPVGIWIMRGFFATIPKDVFDAAKIDGCSYPQMFWKVALPLARPGIISVGLFTFINIWNNLIIPLIMTVNKRTMLTVYASAFGSQWDVNYGGAAAVSVLSAVPTILIAVVFRKQLIEGFTAGAVKG